VEIIIALILVWLTSDDDEKKRDQRQKIKREHNARKLREEAKRKRARARARARSRKRMMKSLEKRIRKATTGYATPKHKREAARLHREFNKRKKEYEEACNKAGEKV
jgi:hypothetical protein